MSISIAELTGVAARVVGVCVGVIFVMLAFLPKFTAVIVAIPGPVVAAFFIVLIALLFVFGMKIVLHDGLDQRKSLIVGMGFLLGVAFQLDWIFPEYLQGAWGELLGNGMTVGGFTVIALTLFDDLTASRRVRLRVALNADAYPTVDQMLSRFAVGNKWNEEMTARVRAVGEETLLLLREGEQAQPRDDRHMLVNGARGRRCRRPGVRRRHRRNEHRGPDGRAPGPAGRHAGRGGGVVTPAAALRLLGSPPSIPRHRRGDRSRGTGHLPVTPDLRSRHPGC